MSFWSNLMNQLLEALKNEKVSGTVLVALILSIWYAYGWAEEEFVRKDEFKELKTIMVEYISDSHIVYASQTLRDKELKLKIVMASTESPNEIERVSKEVEQAKSYRDCLIKKQPNCKYLKPAE